MNIVWNNLIHGQRWKVEVEGLEKEIFLLLFYLCSQHAIMPKNKRSRSGEKKSMGIKSNIPYLCFMLLLCLVFNLSILSYTLFLWAILLFIVSCARHKGQRNKGGNQLGHFDGSGSHKYLFAGSAMLFFSHNMCVPCITWSRARVHLDTTLRLRFHSKRNRHTTTFIKLISLKMRRGKGNRIHVCKAHIVCEKYKNIHNE